MVNNHENGPNTPSSNHDGHGYRFRLRPSKKCLHVNDLLRIPQRLIPKMPVIYEPSRSTALPSQCQTPFNITWESPPGAREHVAFPGFDLHVSSYICANLNSVTHIPGHAQCPISRIVVHVRRYYHDTRYLFSMLAQCINNDAHLGSSVSHTFLRRTPAQAHAAPNEHLQNLKRCLEKQMPFCHHWA